MKIIYQLAVLSLITISCKQGPKVITAQSDAMSDESGSSNIFTEVEVNDDNSTPNSESFTADLHKVIVQKVLPAQRYSYLLVTENGKESWIAVRKQDIEIGATYFYRNGLLKTNFESKEYNRVFERIYLVSNLVPENHGNNSESLSADLGSNNDNTPVKQEIETHTDKIIQHKGSVTIAQLVEDPQEYAGKTIQVTGKCVKINPNIMQRNWIHLQDGSRNDFDLVVTSNTFVPEGKIVTMKAKVSLNKDFGAGYRYDLILEEGVVIE